MTFLKFSLVGGAGFLVDAMVFFLAIHRLGCGWAQARVLAFVVAVSVTWLGNRRYTFGSDAPLHHEGPRYLLVQCGGCLTNYLSFLAWVSLFGTGLWLVPPYLAGTAGGLAFNYTLSRRYVFQHR